MLTTAADVRRTTSITFDETFYLNCGLQTVHDRRLDPRLAMMGVAPLPILVNYVVPLLFTPRQERPDLWGGSAGDSSLINAPRKINALVAGVGLVACVFAWLYRRRGLAAATFGASMIALSPTILAHVSIATSDALVALCTLLALAALTAYLKNATPGRLVVLAGAVSAAMAAKYSAFFLLPAVAGLLWINAILRNASWPLTSQLRAAAAALRTFLIFLLFVTNIWWGFHMWSFAGPLKDTSIEQTSDHSTWVRVLGRGPLATQFMDLAHSRLKAPAPLVGVRFQAVHNEAGHSAYLMGQRSREGWWYYYPLAFFFKSTPSELILVLGLLLALADFVRRPLRLLLESETSSLVLVTAVGIFAVTMLMSRIAIGHRYLIIVYPIIVIVGLDRLFGGLRRRYAIAVSVVLVLGQFMSYTMIAPQFLAYFNRVSGGPEQGHQLLVDSNLDWGQDLPALREVLSQRQNVAAAISYFGTADPKEYGLRVDHVDALAQDSDEYDLLAVSVTHLHGVYAPALNPFREFLRVTPDARAGYSILLFALDTPDRRAAFRQAVEELKRNPPQRPRTGR